MLTRDWRIVALAGVALTALIGTGFVAPVAQDPAFHDFADTRTWLGIRNFGDVASNAGFLIVGAAGLCATLFALARGAFARAVDALPYGVLFAGVTAVTFGSAAYHLAPDNAGLMWDRLPIVVAFMGFLSAVIAERIGRAEGHFLLPLLLAAAVGSVLYWFVTEAAGAGDLRFYAYVQFFPMALIPLMLWMFPNGRILSARSIVAVLATYGVAVALQQFDGEVLKLTAGAVSGHSLKHVAAALACVPVVGALARAPGREGRVPRRALFEIGS